MTTPAKQTKFDIKVIDYDNVLSLPEVRASQLKLVEENPFVEITNNKTYIQARRNRTNLLKGRTGLNVRLAVFVSDVMRFKSTSKSKIGEEIEVTHAKEKIQQAEIDRYEVLRKEKRLEKARKNEERILKHNTAIDEFVRIWKEVIENVSTDTITELETIATNIMGVSGKFEEFDPRFEQEKVALITVVIPEKRDLLNTEIEKARLEKEKAVEEKPVVSEKEEDKAPETVSKEKKATKKNEPAVSADKEYLISVFEAIGIPEIETLKEEKAMLLFDEFKIAFANLRIEFAQKAKDL